MSILSIESFSSALSILTAAHPAQSGTATVPTQTFAEFLAGGGPVMVPIGICSVLVVGLALDRYLATRRSRLSPPSVGNAIETLLAGDPRAAEAALANDADSAAARILRAGLRRRGYALREVELGFEDQAHKESDRLVRNIRPISLIAAIAPLLGLLGTVLGIADSFRRVSVAGMGKPEMLAGGIEMALTTTIAGLCVAIPAMLIAAWLHGRVRAEIARIDELLGPAVEALARRPSAPEESHAA